MTIFLTIILTLIFELIIIGGYLIINKNSKLEKIVNVQNEQLDQIKVLIAEAKFKIEEIDEKGTFRSDDELGYFWLTLKNIFQILSLNT